MKYSTQPEYISLMEIPQADRPRERIDRLGAEALSDKELLMLMIGSGNSRTGVEQIASALLEKLDTDPDLGIAEIQSVPGIGQAKAASIQAAIEFGRRRTRRVGRTVTAPDDIFREIHHYATREQEQLIVIILNGAHEIITTEVVTIGLLNKTIVHPREIFSEAISKRAASIAIAHNHPSGNLTPSDEDKIVTSRILRAGEILGIKVIDHLIFSTTGYYSFLEHGLLVK